jgi:mRNA interferase HicA
VKRRDLLAHLRKHGCQKVREGRRHSWWGNPANNRRSSIPRHTEIGEGLVKKICKDLGIPEPLAIFPAWLASMTFGWYPALRDRQQRYRGTAMEAKIDELLRLGRERGYVTYDQVTECLAEGETSNPEKIDQLLAILEEHGLELIEESDRAERDPTMPATPVIKEPREARVIRSPLFVRSAEVESWLRGSGIEFGGCAGRFDVEGSLFEVELTVPGERALATWWRLRQLAPRRGLWPYIDGEIRFPELGGEEDAEPPPPDGEFVFERIDPAETRAEARRLLEDATRTPADPRTFRSNVRVNWSARMPRQPFVEATEPAPVLTEDEAWAAALPHFEGHCEGLNYTPYPWMKLVLVPAMHPWEVFAYRPQGGWNATPWPEEHLAMQRSWYERFGAELVLSSANGAIHEYFVARPPRTRAEAQLLACEQDCFGEETIIWRHRGSEEDALDRYRTSHYWYFWWG